LTVVLFPISSNAIAAKANTKQNARQTTNTFLMAGFFSFLKVRTATARGGLGTSRSHATKPHGKPN
jgi:hypothetical protein